jgi:hypothetical protein
MDQKMNILENKTDAELIRSLLAEIAKTQNEIRCARGDLEKANSRVNFCIAVLNELVNRHED